MKRIFFSLIVLFLIVGPGRTQTLVKAIEKVKPSVVAICSMDSTGKPILLGTGVCVQPPLILTAYHVIQSDTLKKPIVAWISPEGKTNSVESYIAAYDPVHDLALIRIVSGYKDMPKPISIATSEMTLGEEVGIAGNPSIENFTFTLFRHGTVGGSFIYTFLPDKPNTGFKVFVIDSQVSPGVSGGPVFDMQGRLLGVVSGYAPEDKSMVLTIPIKFIANLKERK